MAVPPLYTPRGQVGRPRGHNKDTLLVKDFCRGILECPEFKEMVMRQIKNDSLPAPVIAMMFHYVAGKPKETLEIQDTREVQEIPAEVHVLADRAVLLMQEVQELKALTEAEQAATPKVGN